MERKTERKHTIMERQRRAMIHEFLNYGEAVLECLKPIGLGPAKDAAISQNCREKAMFLNQLKNHTQTLHEKQWKYCTQSVNTAPPDSEELARAYNERAKFLLHLYYYKECLSDIECALVISALPKSVKVFLLCLKVECLAALHLTGTEETLQEAYRTFDEIDEKDENRLMLKGSLEAMASFIANKDRMRFGDRIVEARQVIENNATDVEIAYSEKYGRHLVAKRDIHAGEIVFAEKFYAAVMLNISASFGMCSHCLNCSFSLIPCDTCELASYCSVNCKREALTLYHDIECNVARVLWWVSSDKIDKYVRLALKMVIMGYKEAGSIEKLKEMIVEVESCKDNISRGMANGHFGTYTFKAMYNLSGPEVFERQELYVKGAAIAAVSLAMNSSIIGSNVTFLSGEDIVNNGDLLFLSTLMYKMIEIASVNAKNCYDPVVKINTENGIFHYQKLVDFVKGYVITPHSSYINHSCNPNVFPLCTDFNQIAYYTVLPVQKGSQIFEGYCPPYYSAMSRSERRTFLKNKYLFGCYCEACTNKWESVAKPPFDTLEYFQMNTATFVSLDVVGPLIRDLMSFERTLSRANVAGSLYIRSLAAVAIEKLLIYFPYPNPPILAFMYILRTAFDYSIGPTMVMLPPRCQYTLDHQQLH